MRFVVLLLAPILCFAARGEEPLRGKEAANPLREEYQKAAKKYEFFLDKERKVPLTLEPKTIFSWAQDDDWNGDVFVWSLKGRPVVVGCILSGPGKLERPAYHEFHLLTPDPIAPTEMTAKYSWAPKEGVEFRKLEGAPAAKAPERLRQMREIARELHAFMQADGEWELRLLPQPIHRYQPAAGDVIDGALFTWVWTKGTDPEVIVAVECHRTPKGTEWRIAPLRFSNRELWLKHGEKEVWRVAFHREEAKDKHTGVYTTRPAGTIVLPEEKKP